MNFNLIETNMKLNFIIELIPGNNQMSHDIHLIKIYYLYLKCFDMLNM